VCSVASARRLKPLAEVIILRFRLQALKKTERTAITSKATDERAALALINNQRAQNAEWPLSVEYAKDAMVGHLECCLTGSGNNQTRLTVATSTTMTTWTSKARGSPIVPVVSACRGYVLKDSRVYRPDLHVGCGQSPATSPHSLPLEHALAVPQATELSVGAHASAPADTGKGGRNGAKEVRMTVQPRRGTESRRGFTPLFAAATRRTSSSGENCLVASGTRLCYNYLLT
jgi:hypothetical protein